MAIVSSESFADSLRADILLGDTVLSPRPFIQLAPEPHPSSAVARSWRRGKRDIALSTVWVKPPVTWGYHSNCRKRSERLLRVIYCHSLIMRPSSLGGGRILRRTLSVCPSVCLSVCLSVRPVRPVMERHLAPPSELQWHTEGRITYGHLGRTNLFYSAIRLNLPLKFSMRLLLRQGGAGFKEWTGLTNWLIYWLEASRGFSAAVERVIYLRYLLLYMYVRVVTVIALTCSSCIRTNSCNSTITESTSWTRCSICPVSSICLCKTVATTTVRLGA